MKVYVYPNRYDPMGYYRLIWPARALQAQGYDVTILGPEVPDRLEWQPDRDGNVASVNYPSDADVIVLQRVTQRQMVDMIKLWQDQGIAVVLDMDDDLSAVSQSHNPAAWKLLNNPATPDVSWKWTDAAAKVATLVTCSTEAAAERYGGVMLPNRVPQAWTQVPYVEPHIDNRWGWTGAVPFRFTDPDVMGGSAGWLQRNGYPMHVVGQPDGVREAFRLDDEPTSTGFVPIELYPYELARLRVGVSPLADNAFNRSKSWNKMLEYAAVGIPCVVSPQAEYLRLCQQGVGLVARSPAQWKRLIINLSHDDGLWEQMRDVGRRVARKHTVELHAPAWWAWWETARKRQKNGA